MRKELLNHRPTSALRGQSLLCESVGTGHTSTHPSIFTKVLLVLLTTLLLPSAAWADYNYGGEALTFYRMNDSDPSYYYSGSEDNKTIEWNANTSAGYESSQSAYTSFTDLRFTYANSLTGLLNNITIVGNNTESALQDATIKVYKLTTPDATDETQRTQIGTISNEGATYTYTPTDGVQGFNNEYIQLAIVPTGDNQRFYTNQIKSITLTFSGTEYDLYVGDYHVTSYNASNVLGNGTVSYDADTKKLTLTNATLKKESVQEGVTIIIPTEISSNFESEQLTIDLVGTNKLYGFISDDSSAGTLKFTGTGSLEITNHDGTISGYTDVDFGSFKLKSNSPGINYGEESGVQDSHRLQDYTKENVVSDVTITTETTFYPIWLYNGTDYTQITADNKANVLGDDYKSISYDGSGKLTLKGAVERSDKKHLVAGEGLDALTVYLVGYSSFKNFHFTGSTALTLATNETYPGALEDFSATWSDNTSRITYANGLINPAGDNPKVTASIQNLKIGYITGTDQNVAGENSPYTIYGTGSDFSASSAEKMGHYIKISGTSEATLWPSSLSNANLLSNVLFQFDWGTCGNTNVTVQVKGLTEDGALDGKTYSDLIALSTANADGVVDIELNGAVTSKNLQLVFTSASAFSIVPLSVGLKDITYDLVVNGTTVSWANKDNVLGEDFATVLFTPATDDTAAKLTLDGASFAGKITSGLEALTIEIKGTSSVGYINTNTATEGDKTLTITKGSDNSSLALTAAQDHSVIEGFKSVSVGEGLYVQSANPCVYSTSNMRYETTDATPALLETLAFTTTPYYPLWVTRMQSNDSNTYQVNNENKSNILNIQKASVQFDGTNTLTFLEDEDLYYSNVYVTSGLDALTIAINGSCKLSSFNKNDNTPAITSVNPDAPLTIALAEGVTSEEENDLVLISAKGKAISGFKSLTYTGLLNLTDGASYSTENLQWSASEAAFATEIKKPTIEINYNSKYFSIKNPNAGGYGGTLMRKTVRMTSEGKVEDDEESISESNSQDYNNNIAIWKYWVKANDIVSDPIYACRLGLEDVEVTYGDTEIPTPNMLPESIDGVSLSYSTEDYEADVAEVVEGTITIKSTGRQPIDATFSNIPDDYTFLTDEEKGTPEASFSLLVKPQKPTLSLDAGSYVGTQTIEVGNISPNATAKYYTYEGTTAPDNPTVSEVPLNDENNKYEIEIESTKTLVVYSEAEYDLGDNTGTGYLKSETESATYTIRIDISNFSVLNEDATDDFEATATYTGSPIVPKFTVVDAKSTSLTAGTDYSVKYYKVVEGEVGTTEVDMIDVGTYMIVISGEGNYGGTKEIEFSITQSPVDWSDDKWTSPEGKTDLKYTGEDLELVTAATVPEGVTIKYYTKYSSEQFSDYDYSESQDEEWSEEVPTGKEIGYYAVFYKVEESDNYLAWGPGEVGIAVNIGRGEATITAGNQTTTYTGSPIEYDKDNITLSPATISKDGIGISYFELNPDNPDNPISLDGAPTAAGTYTVDITLADEHYDAETVNATLTISPKTITTDMVTLSASSFTYNGDIQEPEITVKDGETTLKSEAYGYSYSQDGTAVDGPATAGTYTLTIYGKGNYTGEITKEITITPKEIATANITVTLATTSYTYDGTAHTPGVSSVTISDVTDPIEYEDAVYTNNVNAALATATENAPTVTVSLKGNYSGTGVATFTIEQADLSDYVVTGLTTPTAYTGSPITPTFSVKATETAETSLTANTDYSVKYQQAGADVDEMKDAGDYKILITGEGNYKGSLDADFTIERAQLNLTINLEGWAYGDTPNEPSLEGNLGEGDITWEYKAAGAEAYSAWSTLTTTTNAGTYMVKATVAETDNYEGGSKEAEFVIEQLDISQADITLDNNELTYNGEQQTVNVTKVMAGNIEVPIDCYEVSGNTEKEAGDYKLTVTAKTMDSSANPIKNNFTGSAEKNWKIKNRTVTTDELGLSENQSQATYYSETEDLEVPEGVVAYIITGVNGNNVVTQRIRYIKKGVAVFVEQTTSTENPLEVIPDASELPLKGTAVDLNVASISGGTVYVLYKGEFVKSTTGTIPAKRCYLLLPNNVAAGTRAFGIIGGGSDGSTAIKSINDEPSTIDNWYDMGGHRIEKPTKTGIYIKNGKKVTIK